MRFVSQFEANLLRILHGILDRAPLAQIQPLIIRRQRRPPCLSRDCVELVKDALSKGCVRLLATRGGWRNERFLREGRPTHGRLWQRTPPEELGLTFSRASLDFLMWITSTNPADSDSPAWPHLDCPALTVGDRLLLYLTYERLRPIRELAAWVRTFAGHALCRLAFPQDFSATPLSTDAFRMWVAGKGAVILESLQHDLAKRWIHVEQSKGRIVKVSEMLAMGHSQEQTLDAFLAAAAARRDLTRFLLLTARRLVESDPPPSTWIASLDLSGLRMADRANVYRAATAFLRRLEMLQSWQEQAQGVSFLDEEYATSQLWKSDWEQLEGDQLCRRAWRIVRALDPIQM